MKNLCIIVVSLLSFYLFANDSIFRVNAGEIEPIDPNGSSIQLLQEKLSFVFHKKDYDVQVSYVFYNTSEDLNTQIGFPIRLFGANYGTQWLDSENDPHITKFNTSINGKSLEYSISKKNQSTTNSPLVNTKQIEFWYISSVCFMSNQKTQINVNYTSEYSRGGTGYKFATYLYGTGNTWKNGIENLEISITSDPSVFIIKMNSPMNTENRFQRKWINDKTQLFSTTNVNPDTNAEIEFVANEFDWIYYISSDFDSYTYNGKSNFSIDVSLLTKEQLRIVRNAFFAQYQYKFKSKDLEEYFIKNISEYKPLYNNVDNMINDTQRKSIEIIKEEERKRR